MTITGDIKTETDEFHSLILLADDDMTGRGKFEISLGVNNPIYNSFSMEIQTQTR